MNSESRFRVGHLLLATAMLSTSLTFSEPVPPTQPASRSLAPSEPNEIVALLTRLSDRDPSMREQARQSLMQLEPDDLPALRRALKTINLPTSDIGELIYDIVTQIYLSDDSATGNPNQGFMGIAMGDDQIHSELDDNPELPMGVLVDGRLPGFASYQMLRNGDVILGFSLAAERDDPNADFGEKPRIERVRTGEEIRALVGALPAGRMVTLTVLRSGKRVDVSFKLGARPAELTPVGAGYQNYRQEQQRKADSYWQDNFANLVDRSFS